MSGSIWISRGGRPRRGRGGRAGGKRPAKTAEDLDQEMAVRGLLVVADLV